MCFQNQLHLRQLKLTEEQVEKVKYLEEKNKQAAREQLLRIQLILARAPRKG
jgi:hypothetical protein